MGENSYTMIIDGQQFTATLERNDGVIEGHLFDRDNNWVLTVAFLTSNEIQTARMLDELRDAYLEPTGQEEVTTK